LAIEAPSFTAIKEAITKQAETFEEFKKTNDARLQAVASGNDARAKELDENLGRMNKDLADLSAFIKRSETELQLNRERLEELEAKASSPGKTASHKRQDEHKQAFIAWIRNKGQSPMDEARLYDVQRKMVEAKDVTIGTGSAGGFAVPEEIAREIERLEKKFSPVRDLVKVVQVGTSDYKELVNIRGTTAGWVGETGTRTATATSAFREATPTHGELYAYPQCSEWSLDDIFFNVEAWLAEEIAQQFAIEEGDAVIRGNGTSKPTGMINSAPTATDDFGSPLRAAAVYQFVASAASPDAILPDALLTLVYKLNSMHRANAVFAMNSNTMAAVRKLKDTTNQYLWQPMYMAGQPETLLGYRVAAWEQMDDVGANTHPVAFGDFRRGYVLADRIGLRITRDNVTNIGFVRFYVRRREGGIVLNNNAIKFLKTT
jgi:HK97 family phage major capsid protein